MFLQVLGLFLQVVDEDHDHFENGFTGQPDFGETLFEVKGEEVQDPFDVVSVG
jgi:hypothetical protein